MPRRADLVIHEIFGSQLFDEGVNDALADARRRLLKPGAPSLPSRAAVRCALARETRVRSDATLADVHGFDLSYFALLVRQTRSVFADARGGLELVSEAGSALAMDFDISPPFGGAFETIGLVSAGGRIDGLTQWIEIDFPDGGTLDSNPFRGGPNSNWAATYLPLRQPIETLPGDVIDVTFRHRGVSLTADAVKRPA